LNYVLNSLIIEATCQNIERNFFGDIETLHSHLVVLFFLSKLGNVLQNLFQEVEEFLTVDIVLKSKLYIIVQNLLEDLVGRLFINALSVRNQLDVLLGLFVVDYITLISGCLRRNYNANRLLDPTLVK